MKESYIILSYFSNCIVLNIHATCLLHTDFITHSASLKQIKYIYEFLLPDLHNKTILDVGSRTGALLYGVSAVFRNV